MRHYSIIGISLLLLVFFSVRAFSAERVVVCEMIGDEE
jgi:hypothetical protein